MCCKWTGVSGFAAAMATLAGATIGVAVHAATDMEEMVIATAMQEEQAAAAMTADEVLQRSIDASFGDAAVDRSVKRMRMAGSFDLAAMGISGTLEVMIDGESGDILIRSEIPGMMTQSQGVTGGVGWSNSTMEGPRLLTEDELGSLVRQANLYADIDFTETYSEREYLGEEDVDGVRCHVVSLTPVDGSDPVKRWYSAETGLQLQQESTTATQMGEVTMLTRTEEFMDVDGVTMPSRSVNTFSGIEQVMVFESIELNPDFDADLFTIPDAVKELLDND